MKNQDATQALVDAWNTGDLDRVLARYTTNGSRFQAAWEEATHSGDSLREHIGAILTAMPMPRLEPRSVIDGGDTTVLEWTFVGDVVADFGPIPGNGQHLELKGVSVIQFDADGLVKHENAYWDGATMMAGAGMLG